MIRYFGRGAMWPAHSPKSQRMYAAGMALLAGRMTASWGAESLFGTDGMGYYSLYFVSATYLLATLARQAPDFGAQAHQDSVPRRARVGHQHVSETA
jgi:hypothetical protein